MVSIWSFKELWNIEYNSAKNDRQKILGQSSSNSLGIISGLFVINRIMDSHISEIEKNFYLHIIQSPIINIIPFKSDRHYHEDWHSHGQFFSRIQ